MKIWMVSIADREKADLVLVNGDVAKNIKNRQQMERVFKDGISYDVQKIFDWTRGMARLH